MNISVSCDVNKAFQGGHENSSLKPIDMMRKIIDAIPAHCGLKEDNGSLKASYPGEVIDRWNKQALWFDAATLADVACYHMTFHSRGGVEKHVMDWEKILDAVRLIPAQDVMASFKKICSVACAQRDEIDGRQTDMEEFMNFNKRMDIAAQYRDSLIELNLYTPTKIENQAVLQLDIK